MPPEPPPPVVDPGLHFDIPSIDPIDPAFLCSHNTRELNETVQSHPDPENIDYPVIELETLPYGEEQETYPVPSRDQIIEALRSSGTEYYDYAASLDLCRIGESYKHSKLYCSKWRYCNRCRNIETFRKLRAYLPILERGSWSTTALTIPPVFSSLEEGLKVLVDTLKVFKRELKRLVRREMGHRNDFALLWVIETAWSGNRWHPHVHLVFRASQKVTDSIWPLWSSLLPEQTFELRVEPCRNVEACVAYARKGDIFYGRIPVEKLPEYIQATNGIKFMRGVLGKLRATGQRSGNRKTRSRKGKNQKKSAGTCRNTQVTAPIEATDDGLVTGFEEDNGFDQGNPAQHEWLDVLIDKIELPLVLSPQARRLGVLTIRKLCAGPIAQSSFVAPRVGSHAPNQDIRVSQPP